MATNPQHLRLAQTLPLRLQKFFVLCPPRIKALKPEPPVEADPLAQISPALATTPAFEVLPPKGKNPFLPHKHSRTQRWHPPIYSLRRQKELVKLARDHGVEELLPYTPKKPSEKLKRALAFGLRVRGTGVGQKVKGHKWERTVDQKLERRRQAMLEMPAMILKWKRVSCMHSGNPRTDDNLACAWTRLEEMAKWKEGQRLIMLDALSGCTISGLKSYLSKETHGNMRKCIIIPDNEICMWFDMDDQFSLHDFGFFREVIKANLRSRRCIKSPT